MSLTQIPLTPSPMSSYIIIPAITAVASRCSRVCGFTDLGQAISLLRQGEYSQAGGKALEGTLRLGMLVAVVWSLNEISVLKERNAKELLETENFWKNAYQKEAREGQSYKELYIQYNALYEDCAFKYKQLQQDYGITNQ